MNIVTSLAFVFATTLAIQDPQGYFMIESTPVETVTPDIQQVPLDYTTAYENAQGGDKPLLVLVTATWCPPCQVMKSTTIPDLMSRDSFKDFHYAMVDLDQEEELARQLIGDRGLPQLIMYEKQEDRWLRRYLRGMQSTEAVEAFVAQASTLRTAAVEDGSVEK